MPTHREDLERLSISQLSRLTGRAPATIRERLEGLAPIATDGRTRWYSPPAALERVFCVGEGLELSAERARLAAAQAERIELELAETRGELARWEDMEAVNLPILSGMMQRLRAAPSKAAPQAHGAATVAACEGAFRLELEDALRDVSAVVSEGSTGLRRRIAGAAAERRRRARQRPAPAPMPEEPPS